MAELENYVVRPYQKGDNKHSFSCGNPDLDHYFRAVLSQGIKRNLAAGYVLWDEGYKGRDLGRNLLMSVLELTCSLKNQIGIWGLAVDPIDQGAESFYSKFDFQKLPTDARMFINVQTIEKLFR